MPDLQDQHYLAHEQYRDASHLNARIQLHQRFSTNPYGWFRWVFDQLALPPEAFLLEVGCGAGSLWLENQHRIPRGWKITLSDFSPGMVTQARANLGLSQNSSNYEASDGMAIPFPNKTFTAVIANHVFYHIPDRPRALAEIHRVLEPGGRLFATTIGGNHFIELGQIMRGFIPTGGQYYSPGLNPQGFTLENGADQLSPWFENIEIRHYPDSLVITEAQPLIDYILSMITWADVLSNEAAIDKLSALVNRLIDQHGSIHIQKCSGMFICEKKEPADE